MTFSGLPFLFGFLPLFLAGFALTARWGDRAAKTWLLLISLLFYSLGAFVFLPLLLLSMAFNYALLRLMHCSERSGHWALAGIVTNLAVLGWFKYASSDTITPLGLSFFTFSQIGCLTYHSGGDRPPPKPGDYALFVAFFPALLAGPILKPGEILPGFAGRLRLTADNVAVGSGFFLVGLLKKTLLADPLAPVVSAGFADPGGLTLGAAWQAAASYSLELYFDFSGYSDMAIGLAAMVGLRFPDNFDRPYRAASVIEYWQRWHISLTRFLMTHVHTPLALAVLRWRRAHGLSVNASAQRTVVGFGQMIAAPLVVTMVLVALWHGATAPFLAFGLLHAGFLLVNHLWRLNNLPAIPPGLSVALTYLCVLAGSVVFRSASLSNAGLMLGGMVGTQGLGGGRIDAHVAADLSWLLVLYGIVWFAPATRQWMASDGSFAWRRSPGWAVAMGGAATLGVMATGGTGEFLYFRF